MKLLINLISLNWKCSFQMTFTIFFFFQHSVEQRLNIMLHCVCKLNYQMTIHYFFVIIRSIFPLSIIFIIECSTRWWIIVWLFSRWIWFLGVRYFIRFIYFRKFSDLFGYPFFKSSFQVSHYLLTWTENNYHICLVIKGKCLYVLLNLDLLVFFEFPVLFPLELPVKFPLGFPLYPCSLYSSLFHLSLILNLNQVSELTITRFFFLDQNIGIDLGVDLDLVLYLL